MKLRLSLLLMLGFLLLGCSSPVSDTDGKTNAQQLPSATSQPSPSPTAQKVENLGQSLPVSATATMAGTKIQLEVAQTPEQQAMGLMYRTSLADDRGMLFVFNPPRPVGFWMKNTLIPLDMVFLRKGVVMDISANVPPCTTDPCPTYGPGRPVDQVIELRAGRAKELGLKVGDRVTIQKLDKNTNLPAR